MERRAMLIVEDDAGLRELTAALLEDSELDVIEYESAEAALATMLTRGREVAMIFADVRLPVNEWSGSGVGGEDALAVSSSDPHFGASAQASR
jgi:FixJ family two-component response regulator